jgi:hypothetical protein
MSAGWTGTGPEVRPDVRVLRAHYEREDLLPGQGIRLPARGGAGGHRRAAGVWPGRLCAPLLATVSFRAPPGATGLTLAPGQMDILGWLSAPERECGEVNQFRLLAVEALWQTYIRTIL